MYIRFRGISRILIRRVLFKIHLKVTLFLIGHIYNYMRHYTCIVDTSDKPHVDTQLLLILMTLSNMASICFVLSISQAINLPY